MKRIGLLMPEIISPQDYEFLQGVYSQAAAAGYDVIVFTGIVNAQHELRYDSYIAGLENIYSLVCMCRLDGIIFAAERFRTSDLIDKIYGYLRQTDVPCVVCGGEHGNVLNAREHDSVYEVTEHLISVHGCRKLFCIAGVPGHTSSEERLKGFLDACADNNISVPESSIFYGYFWKDVPEKIGSDIAAGIIEKPDGIVCTSDVMAVSLIDSLKKNGLRVPEDIAVTGFDGSCEASMNEPSVTTVTGRDKQFGSDAVCTLCEMMNGIRPESIAPVPSILPGRSCGCSYEDMIRQNGSPLIIPEHIRRMVRQVIDKRPFIATDFIHRMSDVSTIGELSDRIDEVGHIFRGWDWFDICLCTDWQPESDDISDLRQYGFSDRMFLLLSKRRGENRKCLYSFPTRQLLPDLNEEHTPHIVIMTSLHCDGQIFGYAALAYDDVQDIGIDEYFVCFCDSISSSLVQLQKKMSAENFSSRLDKLSTADPVSGMLNRRGFLIHLPEILDRNRYCGMKSVLLLVTYYPDDSAISDHSTMIADIFRNICGNRLTSRLQEKVYSVILSVSGDASPENEANELIASLENSIRTRFGLSDSASTIEFITEMSPLDDAGISSADTLISSCLARISDKKTAMKNNYMDYRSQLYRVRRNILSQPQLEWSITTLANEMAISRSHFQRLYKQLFSVSVKDDIISARIKRAMQLLTNTDMRIQEIALQCGYNNESHFMRQFKEKCGSTAIQYRRRNR